MVRADLPADGDRVLRGSMKLTQAADVSPVLVRRGQVRGTVMECLPQRVAVVTGRPGVVRDRLEGELQTILLK